MVGIISYGSYIPVWRLSRNAISPGLKGEKAIAGFDEDSITMAVEAGVNCLNNIARESVDGLIFCTTTSPYLEKQAASIVAKALDLRRNIFTADLMGCLRGSTIGLQIALDMVKAGSAKRILVTAADCRLGAPESGLEKDSGDGAAAILVGESAKPVAIIKGSYSVSNELMDVWRLEGERFVNIEEDRFIEEEGYNKTVREAVNGLMQKYSTEPKNFAKAVFYAPNLKCYQGLSKGLGIEPKQMQDSLYDRIGNTGTSYPLLLLVSALEEARDGDKILFASYGDGSDAFIIEAGQRPSNGAQGVKWFLENKKTIDDYRRYLKWRGVLPLDKGRAVLIPRPSLKAMMRRQEEILCMYGVKCRVCGTVQYPPQRVCTQCHSKDQFDKVRLSDKKGEVYTWTADYGAGGLETPIITLTNLEGGGRVFCIITDISAQEMNVGLPVKFVLRKSYGQVIPEYIWKARPI
jgi:hydroxymethylglutaryl-CoA synthase